MASPKLLHSAQLHEAGPEDEHGEPCSLQLKDQNSIDICSWLKKSLKYVRYDVYSTSYAFRFYVI